MTYDFFLDLGIIIISAKILGMLFRRINIPQVVGEIVAGLIIGPNVLGWVNESDFLAKMAELGVIMLMFTAGLETDIKEMKQTGLAAFCIACAGVAVPLVGGYVLYGCFYGFDAVGSDGFFRAVFIGTIITATSVSITVATLREMGHLKGKVGTTILSAAVIDDVIGILVLTFVIGFRNPDVQPMSVVINTLLFFVFSIVVGILLYFIFKWMDKKYPERHRLPIFGFALCLIMSYCAESFFGIADITGAYVMGIILCNIRSSQYIAEKVDVSSYMLFSPVFFASIGLKASVSGMTPTLIAFSIAFIIVALITKIIGCGLMARIWRFSWGDSAKIGVGMMSRGEVGLIVAQKGLAANLIDPVMFTSVILLIVVSSLVTPIILKIQFRNDSRAAAAAISSTR